MHSMHETLVGQAPVALATLDEGGRIQYANPEAERLLGRGVLGRRLADLFSGEHHEPAVAFANRLASAAPSQAVFFEGEGIRPDGSAMWLEVRGAALHARPDGGDSSVSTGAGDAPEGVAVVVINDVSGVQARLEELRLRSLRDSLTGLANRSLLLERLEAEHREGRIGTVLFLDLDRFKLINDQLGHAVGDQLLAEVGRRIESAMPPPATVARFGGDEFAVLLPDCPLPEGEALASVLQGALAAPIEMDEERCFVSAAIGVAVMDPASSDSVLRNADVAMYEAKSDGGGQIRTYRPDTEAYAESRRDLLAQVDKLRQRNELLTAQALTDTLTKLPNRRAFDEALASIDGAARGRGGTYGVAYLDIDHFHELNRAFDDEVGDAALQAIADALADACRAGDVVYRKGGEELVALLVDADLQAAEATAERFAEVVRSLAIPPGCDDCDVVTISGGVAALDPTKHRTPDAVVAEANHAMLLAKRAGRNQVRRAPPGAAIRDE